MIKQLAGVSRFGRDGRHAQSVITPTNSSSNKIKNLQIV
jgi:hypothetical protein